MGKIFTAKVTKDETHSTSIDFKVEIKGRKTIYIRKCQAFADFELNPIYPRSYQGQYEIWDEKGQSHQKYGVVLFYPDKTQVVLDE